MLTPAARSLTLRAFRRLRQFRHAFHFDVGTVRIFRRHFRVDVDTLSRLRCGRRRRHCVYVDQFALLHFLAVDL